MISSNVKYYGGQERRELFGLRGHLESKGCPLAKFVNFFRENGTFIPFSGTLWGARAPGPVVHPPPLRRP